MAIPYGYKNEKGKAVIDEEQAEQDVFKGYLSGPPMLLQLKRLD